MPKKATMISQFEIPMAVDTMAQIYALIDPRTLEIRYVGKAADPARRLNGHMRDSVLARYRDKRTSWLKSLKASGLVPKIVILETVPESDWEACERKWIAHYRSIGANLTNTQDGGEGQSKGFKPSREAIEKTASKLRGRKRAPEVVERIRLKQLGRTLRRDLAEKLHNGARKWWSDLTPEQKSAKLSRTWTASRRSAAANNAHGQPGVSWSEERQKWVAYINHSGKRIPLGRFASFEDAVSTRKAAESRYAQPILSE